MDIIFAFDTPSGPVHGLVRDPAAIPSAARIVAAHPHPEAVAYLAALERAIRPRLLARDVEAAAQTLRVPVDCLMYPHLFYADSKLWSPIDTEDGAWFRRFILRYHLFAGDGAINA